MNLIALGVTKMISNKKLAIWVVLQTVTGLGLISSCFADGGRHRLEKRYYYLGVCVGQNLAQQSITLPADLTTLDSATKAAMKSAAQTCKEQFIAQAKARRDANGTSASDTTNSDGSANASGATSTSTSATSASGSTTTTPTPVTSATNDVNAVTIAVPQP
jgi:hypothetical protein